MCYSVSLRKEEKVIQHVTKRNFEIPLEYKPYYHRNGFTHQNLYIIPMDASDCILPAMWGYIPPFGMNDIPTFQKKYNTLNAKSETIFTSNTFKHSVHDKRCLIIGDGFHEPHKIKNVSYPYFCRYYDDSLFYFAGLYSEIDKDMFSCTILTMQANEQFEKIHNVKKRQPIILDSEFEDEWLRDDLHEPAIKDLCKVGFTTKNIEAFPISRDLYKRDIDTNNPIAITKVNYPELNEQGSLF